MRGIQSRHVSWSYAARISPAHAGNTFSPRGGAGSQRISPAHAGNTQELIPAAACGTDQPRTCGEYKQPILLMRIRLGSAPHMRGIQQTRLQVPGRRGISPAHAGNTGGVARGDHMCGSAPHMRGILGRPSVAPPRPRISPAHAGNTAGGDGPSRASGDQPRTCGEYMLHICMRVVIVGSAPHMRGIPLTGRSAMSVAGISPAHAGNTSRRWLTMAATTDQPRTCGEYVVSEPAFTRCRGSAPHMRGIRSVAQRISAVRRISPAHAGNTGSYEFRCSLMADQPRTCGEYRSGLGTPGGHTGSAPHMRGILSAALDCLGCPGISPAHAGNTLTFCTGASAPTDQPRTCGEYEYNSESNLHDLGSAPHMRGIHVYYISYQRGTGSAPHMRGIHLSSAAIGELARISPAHAGNTTLR